MNRSLRASAVVLAFLCFATAYPLAASAAAPSATVIRTFSSPDGDYPGSLFSAADGNLYGITYAGGLHGAGTFFRLSTAGMLTTLHHFDPDTEGTPDYYNEPIHGRDGNLYALLHRSATDTWAICKMTTAGETTVLHVGSYIRLLLQASDGFLYGSNGFYSSGEDNGRVFRIDPHDGTVVIIATLTGSAGSEDVLNMMQASDGNFYGNVHNGFGFDRWFTLTPSGSFKYLQTVDHHVGDQGEGDNPLRLFEGPDGLLYGTTSNSGRDSSGGTFFRMTRAGVITVLHPFTLDEAPTNGWVPRHPLTPANDGTFIGVNQYNGDAILFKITRTGTLLVLHRFPSDETVRYAEFEPPAVTSDGSIYGAAYEAGGNPTGSIYRITSPMAPQWITPPTPSDSFIEMAVGSPLSFALRAGDADAEDVVQIRGSDIPTGATWSTFDGNAANATLSWSTAPGDEGSYPMIFTARDPWTLDEVRKITVNVRRGTSLTATPEILEISPTTIHLRMTATLKKNGPTQALAGKPVDFFSPSGNLLCTAITDSTGRAVCGNVGTYLRTIVNLGYVAKFTGDNAFYPSQASSGLITF